MKASRLIFTLLLASSVAGVQLAAQQTKADQKPIEEVKAKAEAGDAESQVELGRRYDKGEGVMKDHAEAAKWYLKAAEQNYVDAQFNLGMCYEQADPGTEDWAEVYKWLSLAARQGDEGAKKYITFLESKLMTPGRLRRDKSGRASLSRARCGHDLHQ